MREHVLEFIDPVFHKGDNVTVRLGKKWILQADPEDHVRIRRTDCKETVVTGAIHSLRFTKLGLVAREELAKEHDPSCRDAEGLLTAMRRAYGPDVNCNSDVTVINFWV